MGRERTLGRVDEFTAFVFFGGLVVIGIFLAIGRWYPGSGAEQVDWRLTRSPEVEAELEIDDVDQMIEAQNRRRRATGRGEVTEADIRAQVAADQRWRDELRRRARGDAPGAPGGASSASGEAPPASGGTPRASGDAPPASGGAPRASGDAPPPARSDD
jgi:hypothetical protein